MENIAVYLVECGSSSQREMFVFVVTQKLQEKVCEMESELLSIRQAAQNQQRTIQNLTDSLRTKDTEVILYTHQRVTHVTSNVCLNSETVIISASSTSGAGLTRVFLRLIRRSQIFS